MPSNPVAERRLPAAPGGSVAATAGPRALARALTLTTRQVRRHGGVQVGVSGRLVLQSGIGEDACNGVVTISFQQGDPSGPTFMRTHTPLRADGTFGVTTWFAAGYLGGGEHFGVTACFKGNSSVYTTIKRVTVRL